MFALKFPAESCLLLGILACSGCVGISQRPPAEAADGSQLFYTLTGEIALSRHEPRVAALQYAAAAQAGRNPELLRRAVDVTEQCLQPSLTDVVAARWVEIDPGAWEAYRARARAALERNEIDRSAAQYGRVLTDSPRGAAAEFAALETDLTASANVYGARQVADKIAGAFPASASSLRIQAFAALRADDPAAAVRDFQAALAASPASDRRELTQGLWRARILAGDAEAPLAEAKLRLDQDTTPENRLDYALLLLAAQRNGAATEQLLLLADDPDSKPVALRLLGTMEFQAGELPDAGVRFAELAASGKFQDDAFFYLGLIAERHNDVERALRLYAQVQSGDSAVSALLRAATLLRTHGAAPAAEELLDQLVDDEPQRAPEILIARARIYADAGDLPQAFAVLEQAQLEYPDSVELRYASATIDEEHGRLASALQILKQIAHQRPADPAALNAYGYTLADHNQQLPEARRLIEKAYAAAPANSAILDSLGWVMFREGHDGDALPFLTAAYADEHDGDIAAHLGEVLWHLGRREDAERIWTEGSRGEADNRLIESTRHRLQALD